MGPEESDILIPKPHPGNDDGALRSCQAPEEEKGRVVPGGNEEKGEGTFGSNIAYLL